MTLRVAGETQRLLNPEIITMEALYRLRDELLFPLMANRTFENVFEEKIGDTINIKRPYYALTHEGHVMDNINPMIDRTVTMKIDKRFYGALQFGDQEMTLDIRDFGDRYLTAVAEQLAYRYEVAGANEIGTAIHFMEGTPGTGIDVDQVQDLRAHATEVSIPSQRNTFAVLEPRDVAAITKDVKALFNPSLVSAAVRDRYRGRVGGFRVFESIHVPRMVVHDYGTATPLVNASGGYQGKMLPTDGWGNTNRKILNKGQLIQIASNADFVGEMQLRTEPRRATGRRMTFTVTEDVSCASGAATIPIEPELNAGTLTTTDRNGASVSMAAFQNVDKAAPNNMPIVVLGTKGMTYRQGVFFNRDALEYANIMLELPANLQTGRMTDPETGVSISYAADSVLRTLRTQRRLDILFGVASVYAYQGIRHIGGTL